MLCVCHALAAHIYCKREMQHFSAQKEILMNLHETDMLEALQSTIRTKVLA